jgi:hypothetical protein
MGSFKVSTRRSVDLNDDDATRVSHFSFFSVARRETGFQGVTEGGGGGGGGGLFVVPLAIRFVVFNSAVSTIFAKREANP